MKKKLCPAEFDHHAESFARDPHRVFRELREHGPVVRSDRHGGFWAVLGYVEVFDAARDVETFSSEHDIERIGSGYEGIQIPPAHHRNGFIELDGARHAHLRKLLNPAFSIASVERYAAAIRELATEAIDAFIERGECDVVEDLASQVPSKITMDMLGLPRALGPEYAHAQHRVIGCPPDAESQERERRLYVRVQAEIARHVEATYADPAGDGLVAFLCRASFEDGTRLGVADVIEQVGLILAGGLDTTTSWITNSMLWLWQHPEERARLAADPKLLEAAGEELLRYFSPVLALARTVTAPCALGGRSLDAGDRALLSWGAANADPAEFPDPETVRLDRFPNRHFAFGVGPHRCIGSNLARVVYRGTMTEVLRRLPDYELVLDEAVKYPSASVSNGWLKMPCRFPPGTRSRTA
jgi:cytochrome P450